MGLDKNVCSQGPILVILVPVSEGAPALQVMQAVAPHPRVGGSEIAIIDLEHGVVVPELDVRYADPDLWYEVAMLA